MLRKAMTGTVNVQPLRRKWSSTIQVAAGLQPTVWVRNVDLSQQGPRAYLQRFRDPCHLEWTLIDAVKHEGSLAVGLSEPIRQLYQHVVLADRIAQPEN
jgi:hypothetical protein